MTFGTTLMDFRAYQRIGRAEKEKKTNFGNIELKKQSYLTTVRYAF